MNLTVHATTKINRGTALWSFTAKYGEEIIHQDSALVTGREISFVDWLAVGFALRWLRDNHQESEICLYTDSRRIVSQILGTIETPAGLMALRERCRALALEMPMLDIEWIEKEVPIANTKTPDEFDAEFLLLSL